MLRAISIAFAALLTFAAPALAHSALIASVPADGTVIKRIDAIELSFAAKVRLIKLRLIVNNIDVPVALDAATPAATNFTVPVPALRDGDYDVEWTIAADDGHIVKGIFGFTVSAMADMPGHRAGHVGVSVLSAVSVGIKAALYACCAGAAGGVMYLVLFTALLTHGERRRTAVVVRWMALSGVVFSVARVAVAAMSVGDEPARWIADAQIVLSGSEGQAALVRLAALAVLVFSIGWPRLDALSLAAGGAAVLSFALTGHTLSVGPGILPRVAIALHLLAVAYWIGALVPLLQASLSMGQANLARVLRRFGNVALGMVGILVAAGLFLTWALLNLPDDLIGSNYGLLLFAKLGLVTSMLGLAALNKLRFTPQIEAGATGARAALATSIKAEIAIAALILLVTAAFTTLVGPPSLGH